MTQIGDLFASEISNCEGYTEIFAAPFATYSRVEILVTKKHLDKIFKNFILSVSRLALATCFSRKNCVFCILRVIFKVVFKNFSLFPHASLSLIIPSSLDLNFLLDPFVYSCQKGGEHTLEQYTERFSHFDMTVLVSDQATRCSHVSYHVYLIAIYLLHYTCPFITCFTLWV